MLTSPVAVLANKICKVRDVKTLRYTDGESQAWLVLREGIEEYCLSEKLVEGMVVIWTRVKGTNERKLELINPPTPQTVNTVYSDWVTEDVLLEQQLVCIGVISPRPLVRSVLELAPVDFLKDLYKWACGLPSGLPTNHEVLEYCTKGKIPNL